MKIVTSTMLFEKDLVHPGQVAPVPQDVQARRLEVPERRRLGDQEGHVQGWPSRRSCNNAFINFAPKLSNGDLTQEAQQVYGLGMNNWAIGVPTFDGAVPVQSGAQMAPR